MADTIPKHWRAVGGNTYPLREELKALGGRWCRDTQMWWVPPEQHAEAERLVEEAFREKWRR